jgi:hypothetical protein
MALLNRQHIKLNNRGVRNATAFGSLNLGSMVFIKKLTSDGSDDDLSFVDGTSDVVLDDTYKEYIFLCNDIHPETDDGDFSFQGNAVGGSGYNETITSTYFRAYHNEDDDSTALQYLASKDQAQGTGFQILAQGMGNGNDECTSGYLHLFNPGSTTFIKHFTSRFNTYEGSNFSIDQFCSGYFNTTSAIDEIQFKMASDEIQGGTVSLYGIK